MHVDPHIRLIFYDPHIGMDAEYRASGTRPGFGDRVRVILTRSAEVWQGEAIVVADTISFMSYQVPNPAPDDEVTTERGGVWMLVNRLKDDGVETVWSVRRLSDQDRKERG